MNERLFHALMPILYMLVEACGSICFFDTFLETRRNRKYRLPVMIFLVMLIGYLGQYNIWLKFVLTAFTFTVPVYVWYQTSWGKSLFLGLADYGLLYLCDLLSVLLMKILHMSWKENYYQVAFLVLLEKVIWLCLVMGIRAVYRQRKNRVEVTNRIWIILCAVPLFTVAFLVMLYLKEGVVNIVSAGSASVLVIVNIIFVIMIQNILEEQKKVREQDARNHNILNQLTVYRDMQNVYESQRGKLHDYKKQLTAVQTLLAENHVREAEKLLRDLNGSITVDMSVVNTNQHTVNAVLNQEIAKAKQRGISVTLKINDLQGIGLAEDEIVILLSNLLDNAITACEKVLAAGRKPVIHVKLVCENGTLICAVKNPVAEHVEIVDNVAQNISEPGHGLGLLNVRELAEKYGGDMSLSCEEMEFSAVVMLP